MAETASSYLFIRRLSAVAFLHGDTEFLSAFRPRGIAALSRGGERERGRCGYFSRALVTVRARSAFGDRDRDRSKGNRCLKKELPLHTT